MIIRINKKNKMKRAIKFRGKIASEHLEELISCELEIPHNNGWVVGNFIAPNLIVGDVAEIDWNFFSTEWWVSVIPETIGQFTGLKTGKYKMNLDPDIYEGDLFRGLDADDNDIFYVVMWIDQRGAFYMVPIDHYTVIRDNDVSREKEFDWLFQDALLYDFSINVGLMKVGTIYDNPELTKTI